MNGMKSDPNPIVLFFKSRVETYTRKDGSVVGAHDDGRQAKQADMFADTDKPTHGLPEDKRLPDHNPKSHGDSHSYASAVLKNKTAGHWAYTNEYDKHRIMYSVGGGKYGSTDTLDSKEDAFKQARESMKARGIS